MLQIEEQPPGPEQCKNFAIKRLFACIGEVMNGETTDHDVERFMFFSEPPREKPASFSGSASGWLFSWISPTSFCDQVTGLISACSITGSTGRAIGCCSFR